MTIVIRRDSIYIKAIVAPPAIDILKGEAEGAFRCFSFFCDYLFYTINR
jgi:hypothetical protein